MKWVERYVDLRETNNMTDAITKLAEEIKTYYKPDESPQSEQEDELWNEVRMIFFEMNWGDKNLIEIIAELKSKFTISKKH